MTDSLRRRLLVATFIVATLSACTSAPTRAPDEASALPDAKFDIAGRLSARQGTEGAAASFRWSHRPERDSLTFASPLGSTLAQLEGSADGVQLTTPEGRVIEAADWEALTVRTLGAPVPVRGLASWVRGAAHPGSPHTVERDALGRPSVLRQDGWEIVYAYADDSSRPFRLQLAYVDTELRLVIDRWDDVR